MGGVRKFSYPKWVWSPAGGWWPTPTNWKRNSIIYCVVSAGICALLYDYSERHTKKYTRKYVTKEGGDDHHDHH